MHHSTEWCNSLAPALGAWPRRYCCEHEDGNRSHLPATHPEPGAERDVCRWRASPIVALSKTAGESSEFPQGLETRARLPVIVPSTSRWQTASAPTPGTPHDKSWRRRRQGFRLLVLVARRDRRCWFHVYCSDLMPSCAALAPLKASKRAPGVLCWITTTPVDSGVINESLACRNVRMCCGASQKTFLSCSVLWRGPWMHRE
ncbi:hypothetical protein K438DRAFT_1858192 [Mycena galopus ATCC 62051]|nr:hypothetical protein K438DRAFT_1858192 [Mycena galopus ATCC 62051]